MILLCVSTVLCTRAVHLIHTNSYSEAVICSLPTHYLNPPRGYYFAEQLVACLEGSWLFC
jgi:hypothetical protein